MAYWDELDRAQPAPADVNLWPEGDRAPVRITVRPRGMYDDLVDPNNIGMAEADTSGLGSTWDKFKGGMFAQLLAEPFRKGAGMLGAMQDYSASEFPLQHGVTAQTTDYDPRREAAGWAAGTGFNMVGLPAFTGGSLAGTLGSGIGGGKMIQPTLPAPAFYSTAERAVSEARLAKGTPDQWLGYLRNQPGVKAEEMEWMFGNLPKEGMLTKADMEAHAAANAVKLNEVVKGSPDYAAVDALEAERRSVRNDLNKARELFALDPGGRVTAAARVRELADRDQALTDQIVSIQGNPGQSPKFSQYTLPGGENYREMLLTLPRGMDEAGKAAEANAKTIGRQMADQMAEWKGLAEANPPGHPETLAAYQRLAETRRAFNAADSEAQRLFRQQQEATYKSSHWDEPNVLSHIRMNDREVPGVGKSLHLEEIQSDWHQAGRNKGYNNAARNTEIYGIKKQLTKLTDEWDTLAATSPRRGTISEEMNVLNDKLRAMNSDGPGVPDAPFKSTWADVSLKRSIREAAEKNYDALSWTPGEAQAARYDLSKHVKEIEYIKRGDKYELGVTDINGGGIDMPNKAMTLKEIEDTLGKEMAEKIAKGEGQRFRGHEGNTLSGLDLKVGGEGMKAFYDKMLVDKANALGKKHGARVEQSEIRGQPFKGYQSYSAGEGPTGAPALFGVDHTGAGRIVRQDFQSIDEARAAAAELNQGGKREPVHVLRMTPELRAAAMKGFPLFTLGGAALAPGLFDGGDQTAPVNMWGRQ